LTDFATARLNMVEGQVRPNRVTDPRIIDAMLRIRRDALVPPGRRALAHADVPVPVADGRALLSPMVVARLVQEAAPRAGQRALVLPGLSAYGGLLLHALGLAVTALETPLLAADARARLAAAAQPSANGPTVVAGPLAEGWAAGAPYDVILVEGAVPHLPQALAAQLAEGGRLLAVVGASAPRQAVRAERIGGSAVEDSLAVRILFDAAAPLLAEFVAEPAFNL
jgi:protein-L-isoaspartate(D-aspartate) O-methyltransferase